MGHFTKWNGADWSYQNFFIPLYLLRKNTHFSTSGEFLVELWSSFPYKKLPSPHPHKKKKVLQYVAAQQGFILRTMAFLPPVLCEGLWVVGDEKRESPAATAQQNHWKWWLHPFSPMPHSESDLFERRIANSCCFSKLQLLFMMRPGCLCADAAPSIAPGCLWTVKRYFIPNNKKSILQKQRGLVFNKLKWMKQAVVK